MTRNRGAKKPMTMLSCVRLRKKIVALSISVLVVSIIKIAYEFRQTAQSAIDLSNRAGGNSPPFSSSPHLSVHSPLHLPATSGDPGSNLSLRSSGLWAVSRGLPKSDVVRADMKINNDNTRYFWRGQQDYAPTLLPLPKARATLSPLPSVRLPATISKAQPFLVIIVCSKPENTDLRLAIRRTWGLEIHKSQIVLRFVMGQDETWDAILTREQALHGDVVRTEYLDTYENLSYKVLASLSWVLHNVQAASHVMKIDDDTYVNLPFVLKELRDNAVLHDATRNNVMGAVCVNSSVVRDDKDKWFVSPLSYPSDVYPNYVFGGGYIMTRAAAESIVAASFKRDYLHLEDVFVTGILAKAAAVGHVSHPGFAFWTSKRPSPCDVVTGRRLTAATLTPKQVYAMYSGIHAILRAGNWSKC